jgi:hypothetical protein
VTKKPPPMDPVFSFLITENGPRMTCAGCSKLLAEKGMLNVVMERPLGDYMRGAKPVINGVVGEWSAIYYAIADDYTLADCRTAIRDRHVGQPWGS